MDCHSSASAWSSDVRWSVASRMSPAFGGSFVRGGGRDSGEPGLVQNDTSTSAGCAGILAPSSLKGLKRDEQALEKSEKGMADVEEESGYGAQAFLELKLNPPFFWRSNTELEAETVWITSRYVATVADTPNQQPKSERFEPTESADAMLFQQMSSLARVGLLS